MLKYLFTATFDDDFILQQTPEDKSATDPEKRSQFYDLLQYEAQGHKLLRFELRQQGTMTDPDIFAVDLVDGHFEVNGTKIVMHEGHLKETRLVFFRQHTHSFAVTVEKNREVSHDIVYRMGWQGTGHDGKNLQEIMNFN